MKRFREAFRKREASVGKALSWSLKATVMGMLVFAMTANFIIIAQATVSPLSRVKGDSMHPHIKDGDAVLVKGAAPEELNAGDVVVFPDPEDPVHSVVHRIVALEERNGSMFAVTKGDANSSKDPFAVPLGRVSGEVMMVLPRGGFLLEYLLTPGGFTACVILPILILALYLLACHYLERPDGRKGLLAREIIPEG